MVPRKVNAASRQYKIQTELRSAIDELEANGMIHSARWCTEMLMSMENLRWDWLVGERGFSLLDNFNGSFVREFGLYQRAKALFDKKHYRLCVDYLEDCKAPINVRLRSYAEYLALYRDHCGDMALLGRDLLEIRRKMSAFGKDLASILPIKSTTIYDPYIEFIQGMIDVHCQLYQSATNHFIRAIRRQPFLWSAWLEMSNIVTSCTQMAELEMGKGHWMRDLFIAHSIIEMGRPGEALLI
ncbi:hypothetical protein ACOME3_010018 [Neoechinorhynchus agilis]